MSSSASLSVDVRMMAVVSLCFPHTGISESEQFLKGTSQIKILSPEDIEGMRIVCKVTTDVLLSQCCHGLCSIQCVLFLTCMLFTAGKRSPGYSSHDGETRHYNRRNRPRCASGINPQTQVRKASHKHTYAR